MELRIYHRMVGVVPALHHQEWRTADGVTPPPPAGWEKIVWLMLEAGQAGIGALDLHVYPFLTRLWNDHTYGGQFVREVQDHITSAIYGAN